MPRNKQTFMSRLIPYAQDMTGTSGEGWIGDWKVNLWHLKEFGLEFLKEADAKHTRENK